MPQHGYRLVGSSHNNSHNSRGSGHSHRGGYAVDETGIAHCTVEATLTHDTAFAIADCRGDGSLSITGFGDVPSRDIRPPPSRR